MENDNNPQHKKIEEINNFSEIYDVFGDYDLAIGKLRDLGVIRSEKIVAELGEYFCKELLGVSLSAKTNNKDIDGIFRDRRVQIKTRVGEKLIDGFKRIDENPFDDLIFVVLHGNFFPKSIHIAPIEIVKEYLGKSSRITSIQTFIRDNRVEKIYEDLDEGFDEVPPDKFSWFRIKFQATGPSHSREIIRKIISPLISRVDKFKLINSFYFFQYSTPPHINLQIWGDENAIKYILQNIMKYDKTYTKIEFEKCLPETEKFGSNWPTATQMMEIGSRMALINIEKFPEPPSILQSEENKLPSGPWISLHSYLQNSGLTTAEEIQSCFYCILNQLRNLEDPMREKIRSIMIQDLKRK